MNALSIKKVAILEYLFRSFTVWTTVYETMDGTIMFQGQYFINELKIKEIECTNDEVKQLLFELDQDGLVNRCKKFDDDSKLCGYNWLITEKGTAALSIYKKMENSLLSVANDPDRTIKVANRDEHRTIIDRWQYDGESAHGKISVELLKLSDGWGIGLHRKAQPGDIKTPYSDFSECGKWFRTGITMSDKAFELLKELIYSNCDS